jgi:YHS domain-containing protein/phenylpyruvate tautomerase PptA (4-oxalocrotonate tautomerase family)
MTLIELFAPTGALSEERQRHLGQQLVSELVAAPGAAAELIERGRAITSLVVHEPARWTVGARDVDDTEAPRYVVRISVPGGHLTDGMRAEIVTRVTRVLAHIDDDPDRFYRQPDAWVHIIEVPDGNVGAFGQILPTAAITNLVVRGTRPEPTTHGTCGGPATTIDPICGMTVPLTDTAITLDRDGVTYAFCNPSCRDLFVART